MAAALRALALRTLLVTKVAAATPTAAARRACRSRPSIHRVAYRCDQHNDIFTDGCGGRRDPRPAATADTSTREEELPSSQNQQVLPHPSLGSLMNLAAAATAGAQAAASANAAAAVAAAAAAGTRVAAAEGMRD